VSSSRTTAVRTRNRRGEGSRLRQEILDAASAILEAGGSPDEVTLRAIARHVGIAAPSIYTHFPDRESVLEQLVVDGFVQLTTLLEAAVDGNHDPVDRLLAGCEAYLRFAAEHPHRYRLLFDHGDVAAAEGADLSAAALRCEPGSESLTQGLVALDVLVRGIRECAEAGASASEDPFTDAVAVWVALHGLATLQSSTPAFPWPDRRDLLATLVSRLARLGPRPR
jgi:AcrR family transcriptional regulator